MNRAVPVTTRGQWHPDFNQLAGPGEALGRAPEPYRRFVVFEGVT